MIARISAPEAPREPDSRRNQKDRNYGSIGRKVNGIPLCHETIAKTISCPRNCRRWIETTEE